MEKQDKAINDRTAPVTQPQPRLVAHVSVGPDTSFRTKSVTSPQSQRREPQPERRVQLNTDELSADILALLVSCGQPVRKTDLPKVHSLLSSIPAGAHAYTQND